MTLLPLLRCPNCQGALSVEVSRGCREEVEEGTLRCITCEQVFPIIRFIPRFVHSDQYVRSFSAEWNIFSKTQLDVGQQTETRDTFIEKTGIRPESLGGKLVLDAGCGMGRFSEIVSRLSSATMVGFDLSMAVEAAYQNIGLRPNVHIIQADVMKLPFPEATFDAIFSIGVLHHTPDPKKSFSHLVPLMKNGAEIAIWVYVRSKWTLVTDVYRKFTSKMPWNMVLAISKGLVKLHWFYEKLPYLWKFLPISMHRNPEWRLLDTFDWYSPKYQYKYTENEVKSWFREMKLQNVQALSFPVSVRGKRAD